MAVSGVGSVTSWAGEGQGEWVLVAFGQQSCQIPPAGAQDPRSLLVMGH